MLKTEKIKKECPKCPKCHSDTFLVKKQLVTMAQDGSSLYNNQPIYLCKTCRFWFYEGEEVKF